MFNWALAFFLIALLAALLGFGGLAGTAAQIGYFVLIAAVIVAVVYGISHLLRRA